MINRNSSTDSFIWTLLRDHFPCYKNFDFFPHCNDWRLCTQMSFNLEGREGQPKLNTGPYFSLLCMKWTSKLPKYPLSQTFYSLIDPGIFVRFCGWQEDEMAPRNDIAKPTKLILVWYSHNLLGMSCVQQPGVNVERTIMYAEQIRKKDQEQNKRLKKNSRTQRVCEMMLSCNRKPFIFLPVQRHPVALIGRMWSIHAWKILHWEVVYCSPVIYYMRQLHAFANK